MKDGIAKVKSEIKGVMGMMQNNISKVLDRGAKLEDLQDKSGMPSTLCRVDNKKSVIRSTVYVDHIFLAGLVMKS